MSDSLHSSRASTRMMIGALFCVFIADIKKPVSSPICHSNVEPCFSIFSMAKGRKCSWIEGSFAISWYESERSIPMGLFSSALPLALKKYDARVKSPGESIQCDQICFINVDFPVPGWPLIHNTPLDKSIFTPVLQFMNCGSSKNQSQVPSCAVDILCLRASISPKHRERRQSGDGQLIC